MTGSPAAGPPAGPPAVGTIVEQLELDVAIADQAAFLAQDRAIWTAFLSRQSGFLGKEVWRRADRPDVLVLQIRWTSRQSWQAVAVEAVAELDALMGPWYREPRMTEYEVVC